MPYKEGKKWRAKVTYKGQRYTSRFKSKKAALKWESDKRKELKEEEKLSQRGQDLLTFTSKYTIYSERYTPKTHKEKKSLSKPLGYCRISTTDQLINIIVDAFSLAIVLATKGESNSNIETVRDGLYDLIKGNIVHVTSAAFNDLRMHQKAKEMSKETE